jgi:hypothetical protein
MSSRTRNSPYATQGAGHHHGTTGLGIGIGCGGNETVTWVVRAALLVYAAFVAPNLPANMTWLFDNTLARLVVVLLILGLAMCDPASAILLTVGFVLSIQAANKQHISKLANVATTAAAHTPETFMAHSNAVVAAGAASKSSTPHHQASGSGSGSGAHMMGGGGGGHYKDDDEDEEAHGGVAGGASPPIEETYANNSHMAATGFTNAGQFNRAQTNTVQDNQNTEVRTWMQELGPQGLGSPSGYSCTGEQSYVGFSANSPNCAPPPQ